MRRTTIPITGLSSTLGTDETAVLNHHLVTRTDVDIAVLVTDKDEVAVGVDRITEHYEISEERCRA